MPKSPRLPSFVILALAVAPLAPAAQATLVVIPFAGPIVTASSDPGPLPGFAVGEPVSGSLIYDPAAVTAVLPPLDPGIVAYRLPANLQVVVSGSIRFSGPVEAVAEVRNLGQPAGDLLSFQSFNSAPPFLLTLADRTGTALAATTLPVTLDPAAFSSRSFGFAERIAGQGRSFRLDFGPDASSIPVPEPPTGGLALAGLALLAAGWGWRSRP
jgi:hypothetical protein